MYDIFNALHLTSFADTKVVIIDRTRTTTKARRTTVLFREARCRSAAVLQNIYKETAHDLGCAIPNHGYLVKWRSRSLLLNAVLTVRAHRQVLTVRWLGTVYGSHHCTA
jgi:uracil-DNA glycosylase